MLSVFAVVALGAGEGDKATKVNEQPAAADGEPKGAPDKLQAIPCITCKQDKLANASSTGQQGVPTPDAVLPAKQGDAETTKTKD